MKKSLSFLLFLCLLFYSCKQLDTHVLPAESQMGRGYLAFKANGDICVWNQSRSGPFVPNNSAGFLPSWSNNTYERTDTLYITGLGKTNLSSENLSLHIYVKNPKSNKDLVIVSASLWGGVFSHAKSVIYISKKNSGTIFFTSFDLEKGIASGRFSVDLFNKEDKNQKIAITEGSFDLMID